MNTIDLFKLDGRVALVTGGARGIGFELATALSHAGAIVYCADIDGAGAEEAAERIAADGDCAAHGIQVDVSQEASVASMVDVVMKRHGRLDVCIANAGIAEPNLPISWEDYTADLWRRLIDVNLSGVFFTDMAAARAMKGRGGGSIINIASIVGVTADSQWGCIGYAAAKGGVVQLTRQLGAMLAPEGIRVNSIAPGYVATGLSEGEQLDHPDPEVRRLQAELLARTPMKRYAQPQELRGAALFLASDASSYCTGYTYAVDGGWLGA